MAAGALMPPMIANAPIGVFDSGVGGLSVLRHIQQALPGEHLLYFSDAQFAPYGGRAEQQIEARAQAIGDYLTRRGVKAIVVACNTATAVAIETLRRAYPSLILVGVEPGLKPAAARSHNKIVGVLATAATLASTRFTRLRDEISLATGVQFLMQACVGLADQIEQGALHSATTRALLRRYVMPLLDQGADTLVLGCTHYPFVLAEIEAILLERGCTAVALVDTGEAVTRQLVRLLAASALCGDTSGSIHGMTSGNRSALEIAFMTLLGREVTVTQVDFGAG